MQRIECFGVMFKIRDAERPRRAMRLKPRMGVLRRRDDKAAPLCAENLTYERCGMRAKLGEPVSGRNHPIASPIVPEVNMAGAHPAYKGSPPAQSKMEANCESRPFLRRVLRTGTARVCFPVIDGAPTHDRQQHPG